MVTDDHARVKFPRWCQRYLKDDTESLVADAVRKAEAITAGEIVPMVVERSAVNGHVAPLLFLLLTCLYFVTDAPKFLIPWHQNYLIWTSVHLAVLGAFTFVLARFAWIQRVLTTAHDREVQVFRRATAEFYAAGLNRTQGATGILLLVSLAERQATVLADEAIAAKVPVETWVEVVELILKGVKQGDLGGGLVQGIKRCSEILAPYFPVQPGDINELPDGLILKQ